MENLKQMTLGQIVASNFKTAQVFEKYGIDFCCMGNRNLVDACQTSKVDTDEIISEIKQVDRSTDFSTDYDKWPLDLLAEYVYKKHHKYIEDTTPTIKNFLDKICMVHGANHEELHEIRKIFYQTSGELAAHMKKEELIIFPYIKSLVEAKSKEIKPTSNLFDTVATPIGKMQDDHLDEGEQLQKMNALSNNYTPPEDACTTYTITYKMLQEYESDMHTHIHLENNILFPKAVKLEKELLESVAIHKIL